MNAQVQTLSSPATSSARLKGIAARAEIDRCSNFYSYWRRHYAFSDDSGQKHAQLPWLPYHQALAGLLSSDIRRIGVDKSRQMQISWDITAYLLWCVTFRESLEVLALGRNQDGTDYLIERGFTLWKNQPDFLREYAPIDKTESEISSLITGSSIFALSKGKDTVRKFQANIVFLDECGHMEEFEERYSSSLPMINNAKRPGKIIMAGTPNLHNFWWQVCKDKYQQVH